MASISRLVARKGVFDGGTDGCLDKGIQGAYLLLLHSYWDVCLSDGLPSSGCHCLGVAFLA